MAIYDGSIRINTKLNTDGFNTGIKSMLSSLGGITRALGIAFSVASVVKFGKEAIGLASNLQEVDNVVNKAFGYMRGEMDALADSSIKNLGMSRLMAYQTGSTFMSMGKSMLDSSEDAKNMALSLTKLTANMSSFFNVSQDLASIALKSIYTGETETLKQYGVVMTEVNLKEFAMEQGITKSYEAMSQSEKVMLRYNYVMSQLSYIGDDFIDTQDSWANQTRILSEQWKEFMTIIGNGLITVLTPVVKMLNTVVSVLISFANTVSSILSNVFGIQMQQMNKTASSAESVAGGYSDAADSVDDYADSTKKASKAAKGAIASFDDLNVLQRDTSSGKGTGSGGGGQMQIEPIDTSSQESAIDHVQNKYKEFFDYITKLKDDFVSGFKASWDKLDISSQLEEIKKDSEMINQSMLNIFTDNSLLSAVDNFAQTVSTAVGSISASVISIGATIAQNLIGGMSQYMESNTEGIKAYIINMLDISSNIADLVAQFSEAFANVFSAFGSENGQTITANLIQMFSDAFAAVATVVAELANDLVGLIVAPFVDNQDAIKTALEGLLGVVANVTTTISNAVNQIATSIVSLYDEHIHPFIESVTQGISDILNQFLEFWNTYMQPILDELSAMIDDTYNSHLKPVIDSILEIIGSVIDIITVLWENLLKPLISWIIENILPVIAPILSSLFGFVKGCIDGIIDLVGGLLSAVSDVFSTIKKLINGDWKGAWDSAKKIVKDVVNGILSAVESMANGVVNAINTMIRALNGLHFEIPDWVPVLGGKSFGFSINEIASVKLPRLANGGITTGSTLAQIGEAGREAVLPLENNTGWMDDLASKLASKMPDYSTPRDLVLVMDGKEVARTQLPYLQAEEIRLGIING